jgi:hypothetical protein
MQFLAPLFFVALAGLAIPVLLHLTQREKKQIIRFPSLMFVRRIPYQSVRRRKIQNWLLLMVRLAALALIILAFARPFIDSEAVVATGTAAREVVVLLDTSYSMGLGDHWARAQDAAREAIAGLTAADRGSVVLFGTGAEIQLRSTAEKSGLEAAVTAARPGVTATRYSPALKVAAGILSESTLPRREVVVVSDFQQNGWRGAEGARLPPGATVTPVAIDDPPTQANLSLTGVTLGRSTFSNQQRIVVTAGVTNRTEIEVTDSSIELEVGGLPIASQSLSVPAGGSASVAFDPVTVTAENTQATVRLAGDALETDNAFRFVLSPQQPIRVTVVDRGDAARAQYLDGVLAAVRSPGVDRVSRRPTAVTDDDLRRSAVVILSDVDVPAALARRLARFVEDGGGLFVATGSRTTWPADVDLLPAEIGPPVDRTRGGEAARVGGLEYGHPVFEPFRQPRSGDFTSIPVYFYRDLTAVEGAQVLARFDAGTPAVLERRVGRGRVMVWASTLDREWSDLPERPVFPVLVYQSVLHLAGYREAPLWMTVGQVLDATTATPRSRPTPRAVLTPSGRAVPFEDEGAEVFELAEQGFYELQGEDNEPEVIMAVNVDPAEADVTPMEPDDLAVAAAGGFAGEATTADGLPMTPEARERNQRLWWYLLWLGILLLGADTLLSNRMAKA